MESRVPGARVLDKPVGVQVEQVDGDAVGELGHRQVGELLGRAVNWVDRFREVLYRTTPVDDLRASVAGR